MKQRRPFTCRRPNAILLTAEGESRGLGLLAVGGAAYDYRPGSVTRAVMRGSGCAGHVLGRFEDLPGSRAEVRDVARIWRAQATSHASSADDVLLLSGADASEEAVIRTAASRRAVHFSTHGFVVGTDCGPAMANSRSVGGLTGQSKGPRAPAAGDADNALLARVVGLRYRSWSDQGGRRRLRPAPGVPDRGCALCDHEPLVGRKSGHERLDADLVRNAFSRRTEHG